MRAASLALLLALAPAQDGETIDRWIRELEDDAPAARDRAASALLVAGEEAEAALRKAAEGGSDELRTRAASLLRERERRRTIDPLPRTVTLRAEKRPLREVMADLERQGRTPIDLQGLDDERLARPVSVAVEKVPWLRALDAVCRSHGAVAWSQEWPDPNGDEVLVTLSQERPPARPWAVEGSFAVGLSSISTSCYPAVAIEPARESTTFSFFWAQERGPRPLRASVEIVEILDERGNSWAERLLPPDERWLDLDNLDRAENRVLPAIPPPEVGTFSKIRGELAVEFPTAVEEVVFERPGAAAGVERRGGGGLLKLLEAKTAEGTLSITLEFRPRRLGARTRVVLLDEGGKRIEGQADSIAEAEDEDWERRTFAFQLEGRKPARLRCTLLTGTRERRIPFEFRDVRFR